MGFMVSRFTGWITTEWIATAAFGISKFCALPLGETHQGSCPIPVALGDIIAPTAAWQAIGWKERLEGWKHSKKTTKNPCLHPWSQLHETTCHPVRPSHAIQASPWANKDLFQASPQCDRAEQKQSVPLGCSLVLAAALLVFARRPGRFHCLSFGLGDVCR